MQKNIIYNFYTPNKRNQNNYYNNNNIIKNNTTDSMINLYSLFNMKSYK